MACRRSSPRRRTRRRWRSPAATRASRSCPSWARCSPSCCGRWRRTWCRTPRPWWPGGTRCCARFAPASAAVRTRASTGSAASPARSAGNQVGAADTAAVHRQRGADSVGVPMGGKQHPHPAKHVELRGRWPAAWPVGGDTECMGWRSAAGAIP